MTTAAKERAVRGRRLVQTARSSEEVEPGAYVISGLANPHRMELAFEIAAPEFEKAAQLREVRSNVQVLPDEALQQVGMIRQTVDDLRGGQTIIAGFLLLVVAHLRVLSCDVPSWPKSMRD